MKAVKVSINLNLYAKVPDEMTKEQILEAVYNAAGGAGDPRHGINALADIGYYTQYQIESSLKNLGHNIEINSVTSQIGASQGMWSTPFARHWRICEDSTTSEESLEQSGTAMGATTLAKERNSYEQ